MSVSFNDLTTEKFRKSLSHKAIEIYKGIYKGCKYDRELDINKDKHFSIDATIILANGQKMTIQEKFRNSKFLRNKKFQQSPPYPDFTQEYKNASGTELENNGEYFKLFAQLYFYGWANELGTEFERWCILDVAKYKDLIHKVGINNIGELKHNNKHGKASFYVIPIIKLKSCFLYSNFNFKKLPSQ